MRCSLLFLRRIIFVILLILVANFLRAQPTIIGGKLNGESVISTFEYIPGGSTELDLDMVSTTTTVYKNDDDFEEVSRFINNYEKVFSAPKGRTIKSIGSKQRYDPHIQRMNDT